LANLSLFYFQGNITGKSAAGIPYWVYGSFFVGGVCSIGSVLWSMHTTPEIPPTEAELAYIRKNEHGALQPFVEIFDAIKNMPKTMWQLSLVYLFQWYALFIYWQYCSHSIAQSVWKANSETDKELYEKAVGWTGLVNGWYNVVTFLSAFGLVWMAKKYGAKWVHFTCLIIAGISLLVFPHIENKYLFFAPMTGFGIAWASIMGIPYLLVVGSIPKERFGVYMGIINMMIVIPMILQTLSFGMIYKSFLGSNPGTAISAAGVLLLLAAVAVLRIRVEKSSEPATILPVGGH